MTQKINLTTTHQMTPDEDFIVKKLKYNYKRNYYADLSRQRLSEAFHKAEKVEPDPADFDPDFPEDSAPERWETMEIRSFTPADIAAALTAQMAYNPVRWENALKLLATNWTTFFMYYDLYGFQFEQEKGLRDKLKYSVNLTNPLAQFCGLGKISIGVTGAGHGDENYWALSNLFYAFKTICTQNMEDFKDKKSAHRDEIVVAMNKLYPARVHPQNFGLTLVDADKPEIPLSNGCPLELFDKKLSDKKYVWVRLNTLLYK